jgi:dihydrolipoamide dehydrogenase
LPNLKQDGKKIIGYREAMVLPELPKSMVVVGSGAIGSEFAYFYSTMGTKLPWLNLCPILFLLKMRKYLNNWSVVSRKQA